MKKILAILALIALCGLSSATWHSTYQDYRNNQAMPPGFTSAGQEMPGYQSASVFTYPIYDENSNFWGWAYWDQASHTWMYEQYQYNSGQQQQYGQNSPTTNSGRSKLNPYGA